MGRSRNYSGSGVSIRTALVYEGQIDPKMEVEGYFDFVIPFARLLTEAP